jgi:hypothetical protein
MQRACLTSEAALLLDRASPGPSPDKTVAMAANVGESDS